MTTDDRPPLDLAEQEARIAKIHAERKLLENQLSQGSRGVERWKEWATPLAAIVAVLGIVVSTTQWYIGTTATREAQREERIERNIGRLADKDESQRITAIASLKAVVSGDNEAAAAQTIAAFTHLLAVEGSFPVRSALISSLSDISSSAASARRILALRELAEVSRGLVGEGQLAHLGGVKRTAAPEPSSVAARAQSVGHAIAALLRQGTRGVGLDGVYLAGENLTALNMSNADLRRAVLEGTQFDKAILNGSRFDDAVLAGTSFLKCNLRNASFQQRSTWNYVLDQAYPLQTAPDSRVAVIGPYFDGADLSGARFDGHPLFPIYDNELHQHAIVSGFSFRGARLDGVDLRRAWVFVFRNRDLRLPNCDMQWRRSGSLISFGGTPLELIAAQAIDEPTHVEPLTVCWRTLDLLANAFSQSIRTKALSLNFIEEAVESGRFATPNDPSPSPEVVRLLQDGAADYGRHDFKDAIVPYAKALALEKLRSTLPKAQWRRLLLNLGVGYAFSGNLENAKETFEYGLSKDTNYAWFYYNLACTYAEMNNIDAAMLNLRLAFKYKASPIGGEPLPDPEKDDSFRGLLQNDLFINTIREINEAGMNTKGSFDRRLPSGGIPAPIKRPRKG